MRRKIVICCCTEPQASAATFFDAELSRRQNRSFSSTAGGVYLGRIIFPIQSGGNVFLRPHQSAESRVIQFDRRAVYLRRTIAVITYGGNIPRRQSQPAESQVIQFDRRIIYLRRNIHATFTQYPSQCSHVIHHWVPKGPPLP